MDVPGKEHAKAVEEASKLGQQIVESGKKLFDGVFEEVGALAAGFLRHKRQLREYKYQLWEYKNMLATLDKVEAINRERSTQGKPIPIPTRQSIPLLEALALEDEPSLQDLWARLIANATDPSQSRVVKKAFIDILKSIDPLEAAILEGLRTILSNAVPAVSGDSVEISQFAATIQAPEQEVLIGLYHLAGLGCLRVGGSATYVVAGTNAIDPWPVIIANEAEFSITPLTVALLEACAP